MISQNRNDEYAASGVTAYKGKVYAAIGSTITSQKLKLGEVYV